MIGRALLSLALWVGFWLLALGLVAALAWVPFAQALYAGEPTGAGLLSGLGAIVVAWALRPRSLLARKPRLPEPLSREEFPQLHALANEVARRSGSPVPARIHLSATANAAIWVERRWPWLRRAWVIELGLPLFALLDRDQLAAVLAHEFGHHRGGDLLLGAWVHRTRAALAQAVEELDESAFMLDAPFRAYGHLFLRTSNAVSRAQELAADGHAAALCGRASIRTALEKIDGAGSAWDVYFAHDAAPLIEQGVRLPLLEGYRGFLAAPAKRPEVARALERLAERAPSHADTHPPLASRLAAIGDDGGAPPGDLGGDSLGLLNGGEAAEAAWYSRATTGELTERGWEEVGRTTLLPSFERDLEGTPLAGERVPLEDLPRLVAEGEALWRASARGVNLLSPAGQRRQAQRLLAAWLSVSLARRGFAVEYRPGRALCLRRGALEVEPATIVARLADGSLPEGPYREACGAWGAEASAPRA